MASFKLFVFSIIWANFVAAYKVVEDPNCSKAKSGVIEAYPVFIDGIENLVESSDPITVELIEANLPDTKYFLRNAKLAGLKQCQITELNVSKEKSTFKFNLKCPRFEINSDYTLLGYLNGMYVEGEDTFKVVCYDYMFIFTGYYEKVMGKDNKEHVHIKNYFLENEANGKVEIDFKNLRGANEEKSIEVNKYINEHWKDVDKALRSPTLYRFMDIFIKNLNNFLSIFPVEEIFPNID